MAAPSRTPLFDDRSRYLDRFGLVLALTVVTVIGLALVNFVSTDTTGVAKAGSVLSTVLVATTLLVALRASGMSARRQRVVDLIVGVAAVTVSVAVLFDLGVGPRSGSPSHGLFPLIALLSVAAPVVVVRRLLRHREVTTATLLATIAAYLLIPISFFFVFLTVQDLQGSSFFSSTQPSPSFMYFSLTTLTTTGYGDLTAVSDVARLTANTEAVIGQVYLVTIVAMIVGLRAQAWRPRRDAVDPADGEPGQAPA